MPVSLWMERCAFPSALIGRCLLTAFVIFAATTVSAKGQATVSITMTPYGIPHIVAADYRGLGQVHVVGAGGCRGAQF